MISTDTMKAKTTKSVVVRSIPQDIHHRARIRCAVEQTTLQAVLMAAITEYANGAAWDAAHPREP
jgi:hypothetical protein